MDEETNKRIVSRRNLLRKAAATSGGLFIGGAAVSGTAAAQQFDTNQTYACMTPDGCLRIRFRLTGLSEETSYRISITGVGEEVIGCRNPGNNQFVPGRTERFNFSEIGGYVTWGGQTTIEREITRCGGFVIGPRSECPSGLNHDSILEVDSVTITASRFNRETYNYEQIAQHRITSIEEC